MEINVKPEDLKYSNLLPIIEKYKSKGRGESASFLNWFLENIFRLDQTAADDAICDQMNDKGIDGIYVDHNSEEILILQSKLTQKDGRTIGDVSLKELCGTLDQLATTDAVAKLTSGSAHPDLVKSLMRNDISNLVEKGYSIIGVFVTNMTKDPNTIEYMSQSDRIKVYCAQEIANNYIEFDAEEGVSGSFTFDTSYAGIIHLIVDQDSNAFLFPARANELIKLEGISDGVLFSQNVRYSLGNTPVNKAISKSVQSKEEHKQFPLFHNGITLICGEANHNENDQTLEVKNYVVVNGAQSLTSFFHNSKSITDDLRVFVKVVALKSQELSRKITINSNNQNAIKPRDLRSNHDLMLRLRAEFLKKEVMFEFEIKRGQVSDPSKTTITNEDAGRNLLSFDLDEPYSCHQIYRVFDEKYADIFGRPEVTCFRIIFLHELMSVINVALGKLDFLSIAKYTLTKYILLNVIGKIMKKFSEGRTFLSKEDMLSDLEIRSKMISLASGICAGLVVDLNYEIKERGDTFDYKKEFKSPETVRKWVDTLVKSYEKDFNRRKADGFGQKID